MRQYIITRNWNATEWSLTELVDGETRKDIWVDVDGSRMRKILTFDAPSWEEAREVFNWAHGHLHRAKREDHMPWEEARILSEQEKAHDLLAKKRKEGPRPRAV